MDMIEKIEHMDFVELVELMSGTVLEPNKSYHIVFHDNAWGRKALKRWHGDWEVTITNREIVENSLVDRAWSYDDERAFMEANTAILYFARQWVNNPGSLVAEIQ